MDSENVCVCDVCRTQTNVCRAAKLIFLLTAKDAKVAKEDKAVNPVALFATVAVKDFRVLHTNPQRCTRLRH